MGKSLDGQIKDIIALLNREITNTKQIASSMSNSIDVDLETYPSVFAANDTITITVNCNINKICDNITLSIDDAKAEEFTDVNSFINHYDIVDAGEKMHIIYVEATVDGKTFTINKVLLPSE